MITRIRHTGALWLCTLVLVLTACGSESLTGGEEADTPLPPNTIGPSGGTLDFAGGNVTLVFPAGAVSQNLTVTVQATGTFPSAPTVVSGTAYDFGPQGTEFAQPVQLTVKYDPTTLPSGVQESELRLYKVVGTAWQEVAGSSVNASANTVTGQVTSFSVLGILGKEPVASVTVEPVSAEIEVGATAQLTATVRDAGGNELTDRAVNWSSSDEAVATVDVTGLVTGVAAGSATITATSEGKSQAAALTVVLNLKDVIEALFMGSGPLTPSDGFPACPWQGRWTGFPRGTHVTVRVSTTVSADKLSAIRNAVDQVEGATGGVITTSLEITQDPNPLPDPNEVTSTSHPDPVSQGCPFQVGCTIHSFLSPGVLQSSRAVQPPNQTPNAFAHDVVGHGILGMCHIDGNLIGGAENSLMSGGPGVFSGDIAIGLSALDIEALKAVYGSSLNPGATRSDFLQAGLINP